MYGFINTDSWIANARPKSWREALLKWFPNGRTSLTALTSQMLKSRKITDPEHTWFVKDFPLQRGAITTPAAAQLGVWTNTAMTVAYAGGAVIGTTLHIGVPCALAAEVRTGHTLRLTDASHPRNTGVVLVTSVTPSVTATVGRISCTALELDNNGAVYAPAVTWVNADGLCINGNLNAENASRPNQVQYDANSHTVHTNIWRTPLAISRTAERTKIRYASDAYKMLKVDTLELHGWEMEKAAFTAVDYVSRVNGNPIRSAYGLIPWIHDNTTLATGPSHVFDFLHDATVPAGTTWAAGGKQWLNRCIASIYANGDSERFCFAGIGAAESVNLLAEIHGQINMTSDAKMYGLDLTSWKMAGTTLGFKTHPLFNADIANPLYNAFCILNPRNCGFVYIDDTHYVSSPSSKSGQTGESGIDGRNEEYLTEGAFEWGIPCETAMLYNMGIDKP